MTEKELNSVRDLNKQIRDLENHLATMRKRAEDITQTLDGMPHATTIQSKIENLALKIVEGGRELEILHQQIISATARLTEKICREVTDPQERTVVILRYVSCMHFRDIGFQLGKSDARIFQLHRDALSKIIDD